MKRLSYFLKRSAIVSEDNDQATGINAHSPSSTHSSQHEEIRYHPTVTFGLDSLRLSVHVTYICSGVVHRLNTSWSHHQATASPADSATADGAGAPLETDGLSRYRGLAASSGACVGTILQNGGGRGGPVGGCRAGAEVLDAACELIRGFGHGCRLEEGGGHCVCQREQIRRGEVEYSRRY